MTSSVLGTFSGPFRNVAQKCFMVGRIVFFNGVLFVIIYFEDCFQICTLLSLLNFTLKEQYGKQC